MTNKTEIEDITKSNERTLDEYTNKFFKLHESLDVVSTEFYNLCKAVLLEDCTALIADKRMVIKRFTEISKEVTKQKDKHAKMDSKGARKKEKKEYIKEKHRYREWLDWSYAPTENFFNMIWQLIKWFMPWGVIYLFRKPPKRTESTPANDTKPNEVNDPPELEQVSKATTPGKVAKSKKSTASADLKPSSDDLKTCKDTDLDVNHSSSSPQVLDLKKKGWKIGGNKNDKK